MKKDILKLKRNLLTILLASSLATTACSQDSDLDGAVKTSIESIDEEIDEIKETIAPIPTPEPTEKPTPTPEPTPDVIKYENIYGYILEDTKLREEIEEDSDTVKKVPAYQKAKLLESVDNSSLVTVDGIKGYIDSDFIEIMPDEFIEVDISDQKLRYFKDGRIELRTDVVTGCKNYTAENRNTPLGYYYIIDKEKNRTLRGRGYSSFVERWMRFHEGYGLHDASWRSNFGGEIYKNNGSHGCVNMPKDAAYELYDEIEEGTRVLVHK